MKLYIPLFLLLFSNSFLSKGQGENGDYSELFAKIDIIIDDSDFNGTVLLTVGTETVFHRAK
ncbi:hypothetical protein LZF95_06570 [Algoriphagus sp. AGSA1]|uniref:hypothetical protein n=1 Tax=Algoriphagus sp. AGSA1 TaxID=2907213 RepID=UPI001F2160F3|nr:hypothetical protein [Algoriphagus sp. AGSA1]MCE7054331.1 hypothetical protein [Algoriphagus sp. AGSA1]